MVSIALNSLKWIDGVGVYVDVSPGDCGSIDVEFVRNGQMYCATRPRHRVIELERFIDSQPISARAKVYARKQLVFASMEVDLLLEAMQDTERFVPDLTDQFLSRSGLACVVFLLVVALSIVIWG